MPIISQEVWITREGQQIEISKMPSSHLLSTIHFIERKRFESCFEVYQETVNNGPIDGMLDYYSKWPIQYETLVAEAQHRGLIGRLASKQETNLPDKSLRLKGKTLLNWKKWLSEEITEDGKMSRVLYGSDKVSIYKYTVEAFLEAITLLEKK